MAIQLKYIVDEFINSEDGLTVVEYVVAAALLVAVVTSVFFALQTGLTDKFNSTIDSVN